MNARTTVPWLARVYYANYGLYIYNKRTSDNFEVLASEDLCINQCARGFSN